MVRPSPDAPVQDAAGEHATGVRLRLRLYIAGEGPNSKAALANLRRLLTPLGLDGYDLEIVDCLHEPMRALEDGVLVTPTLVRIAPGPVQTIVGTLSKRESVASALGLAGAMGEIPGEHVE